MNLPERFQSKRTSAIVFASFALTMGTLGILSGCNKSEGDASPPATVSSNSSKTTAPAPASTATGPTDAQPKSPGAMTTSDGETLFASKCAGCHGDKGAGGKRAPILAGKKIAEDQVVAIVTDGKPPKMPGFKATLSPDQIAALGKYVVSL